MSEKAVICPCCGERCVADNPPGKIIPDTMIVCIQCGGMSYTKDAIDIRVAIRDDFEAMTPVECVLLLEVLQDCATERARRERRVRRA